MGRVLQRHCRGGCGAVHLRQNYTHLKPWTVKHMLPLLFSGGAAMFGPMMVMSLDAVLMFAYWFVMCKKEVVDGTPAEIWGDHFAMHEDVFADRCLERIGGHGLVENRLLMHWQFYPREPGERKRVPMTCQQGFVA